MDKNIDTNIELRSEILEASLNLESAVNELLLMLLAIESQKRKAITNKSGSLSFKNKIDLLFDLDIVTSNEHQQLLLLMELRNQFLHNIECNSFEKALDFLGNDKKKKLLNFADSNSFPNQENKFKNAFTNLKIECLKIVVAKVDDRMNQLEDRRKVIVNLAESQIFFINRYFDIIKKIREVFVNGSLSSAADLDIFKEIERIIRTDMEELESSKEYATLQIELKELFTPEKINTLFRW